MAIYNPASLKAEEFISDAEIRETLAYAEANKHNLPLIEALLEKARPKKTANGHVCAGLSHREASVLLACDIPEVTERIFKLAEEDQAGLLRQPHRHVCAAVSVQLLRQRLRVLSLSRERTSTSPRKKLTAGGSAAGGHRTCRTWVTSVLPSRRAKTPSITRLTISWNASIPFTAINHKNGDIRRVNVNIAATTVENYRKLKEAGIGTYILFQETYHKESYEQPAPDRTRSTITLITPRLWTAQWRAALTT